MATTTTNFQEAAIDFARSILADVAATAVETVGVDVLWFRLLPDKRNQDVIFQSYTLYGVEDCPLKLKAIYTDTGYDDAALTYNIMGIEYSIPLTLEIPIKTWQETTGYDNTEPQRGDIVFIPQSMKLLEVVSMTPVKAVGAQLTSFKMNCSAYKPKRSVIVGENLKKSIEESTVNQDVLFGKDIKDTMEDIVDPKQIDLFTGTSKDKSKTVTPTLQDDSIYKRINNIHSGKIEVDGHLVARSYYDMDIDAKTVVRYKNSSDHITYGDTRCLSLWVNISEPKAKNIKSISVEESDKNVVLTLSGQLAMNPGDNIVIERGAIILPGEVVSKSPYKVKVPYEQYKKIATMSPNWYKAAGFTAVQIKPVNLLYSNDLRIDILSNKLIRFNIKGIDYHILLPSPMIYDRWFGVVINVNDTISVDIFTDSELKHHLSIYGVKVKKFDDISIPEYSILSSKSKMTNIRLYTVENRSLDKQIEDIVSYMCKNNSLTIINDSADIQIDDPYIGKQR